MSQFDEVSNIANPTFDAELATNMIVNATLPKTPQSPAAGASDLAVDSLDNKIPIGRARNRAAASCRALGSNGEQRAKFQGAAVQKAPVGDRCSCSKSGLREIRTNFRQRLHSRLRKSVSNARLCPNVADLSATNSPNFASLWRFVGAESRSTLFESEQFSLACYGVRKGRIRPHPIARHPSAPRPGPLRRTRSVRSFHASRVGPQGAN